MSDREVEQQDRSAQGLRDERNYRAFVLMDEEQMRTRMIDAWRELVDLGFLAKLVGVKHHRGMEYVIELAKDGADFVPIRALQDLGDKLQLDISTDGSTIVIEGRWSPTANQ